MNWKQKLDDIIFNVDLSTNASMALNRDLIKLITSIEAEARADERKKTVGKIKSLEENGYVEMPWKMLVKELELEETKE